MPTSLGLLFVVAAVGYYLRRFDPLERYALFRESGHHIFFRSALVGFLVVAVARLLAMPIASLSPGLGAYWKLYAPMPFSGTVAIAFVLAIAANRLRWRYCSDSERMRESAREQARDSHDWLELLIDEAMGSGPGDLRPIEISLESRKVYVGFILMANVPLQERRSLAIIPILSGYRHNEHLGVVFTHNYASTLEIETDKLAELENLQVVVPVSTIRSARLFDLDLYRRFAASEGRSDVTDAGYARSKRPHLLNVRTPSADWPRR